MLVHVSSRKKNATPKDEQQMLPATRKQRRRFTAIRNDPQSGPIMKPNPITAAK